MGYEMVYGAMICYDRVYTYHVLNNNKTNANTGSNTSKQY